MATIKQWENLANEAITDAGYWKERTRKLESITRDIESDILGLAKRLCPEQYGTFGAGFIELRKYRKDK